MICKIVPGSVMPHGPAQESAHEVNPICSAITLVSQHCELQLPRFPQIPRAAPHAGVLLFCQCW